MKPTKADGARVSPAVARAVAHPGPYSEPAQSGKCVGCRACLLLLSVLSHIQPEARFSKRYVGCYLPVKDSAENCERFQSSIKHQ